MNSFFHWAFIIASRKILVTLVKTTYLFHDWNSLTGRYIASLIIIPAEFKINDNNYSNEQNTSTYCETDNNSLATWFSWSRSWWSRGWSWWLWWSNWQWVWIWNDDRVWNASTFIGSSFSSAYCNICITCSINIEWCR